MWGCTGMCSPINVTCKRGVSGWEELNGDSYWQKWTKKMWESKATKKSTWPLHSDIYTGAQREHSILSDTHWGEHSILNECVQWHRYTEESTQYSMRVYIDTHTLRRALNTQTHTPGRALNTQWRGEQCLYLWRVKRILWIEFELQDEFFPLIKRAVGSIYVNLPTTVTYSLVKEEDWEYLQHTHTHTHTTLASLTIIQLMVILTCLCYPPVFLGLRLYQ